MLAAKSVAVLRDNRERTQACTQPSRNMCVYMCGDLTHMHPPCVLPLPVTPRALC